MNRAHARTHADKSKSQQGQLWPHPADAGVWAGRAGGQGHSVLLGRESPPGSEPHSRETLRARVQSCLHGLLPALRALWEELGCSGEGQLEAQPCGRCWGETAVGRIRALEVAEGQP